jgi:hypothetical protein
VIHLKVRPEVKGDLEALPTARLGRVALEWMHVLRSQPHRGLRLRWRSSGDLSLCRKLYFDEDDQPLNPSWVLVPRPGGPRFRIVYRLLPRPERPELILVIAVGPKVDEDGGVYDEAVERL